MTSKLLPLVVAILLISGCHTVPVPTTGIADAISWEEVEGWEQDQQHLAWPALMHSCTKLRKNAPWDQICDAADVVSTPDADQARLFFESWFAPHPVFAEKGKNTGLITGYYEPLLLGSKTPSDRFKYPLYQRPASLLQINLGDRFPSLKNARVRGRLVDNRKIVPFYSRKQIESDRNLLAGEELLWLDNRDDLFFLHIQGSGRVQLPDGNIIGVGYSDQNGHPYKSIGKVLVDQGEMVLEDVSLFSIKQWLIDNPTKADTLLNQNPSYVFFVLRENPTKGPIGSLNVPLTAGRSIAIDPKLINLGVPMWLSTHYPSKPDQPLQRLVFAQDTGGAIKGHVRADLFWGHDKEAERAAGTMQSVGTLIVLLPKAD